jgi:hypothetical protein
LSRIRRIVSSRRRTIDLKMYKTLGRSHVVDVGNLSHVARSLSTGFIRNCAK